MRPIIHSKKHINQFTLTNVAFGTSLPANVAVAVENPSGVAEEVEVGSQVKAVYVEFWLIGDDNTVSTHVLTVEKRVAGQDAMTHIQSLTLHTYPNKKNIFYTTQGILGDMNTNPIPVVRQWIKIPKGKQRMGLGDRIVVNFSAITGDHQLCGETIYKELS